MVDVALLFFFLPSVGVIRELVPQLSAQPSQRYSISLGTISLPRALHDDALDYRSQLLALQREEEEEDEEASE